MNETGYKNPVLASTLAVVKKSKSVTINRKEIVRMAERWSKLRVSVSTWDTDHHLESSYTRQLVDYVILLNSLNFCFWVKDDINKWRIDYRGEIYSGYFALSMSLKKFFEKETKKANFNYLSQINLEEFSNILQGEGTIQLLKKRWEIVRSVSVFLVDNYNGNSERFILSAGHKAAKLVQKIASALPYFNDEATYGGKKVYLWNRAQALVGDIYGITRGIGVGYFDDLDYLTAFSDYKLLQILNHWKIIEYSTKLNEKIKSRTELKLGSNEEVEIRSAAIWAVEYLKEELKIRGVRLKSFEINWLLWNQGKIIETSKSHHLTTTIFY
jgi:hypothetical protein